MKNNRNLNQSCSCTPVYTSKEQPWSQMNKFSMIMNLLTTNSNRPLCDIFFDFVPNSALKCVYLAVPCSCKFCVDERETSCKAASFTSDEGDTFIGSSLSLAVRGTLFTSAVAVCNSGSGN